MVMAELSEQGELVMNPGQLGEFHLLGRLCGTVQWPSDELVITTHGHLYPGGEAAPALQESGREELHQLRLRLAKEHLRSQDKYAHLLSDPNTSENGLILMSTGLIHGTPSPPLALPPRFMAVSLLNAFDVVDSHHGRELALQSVAAPRWFVDLATERLQTDADEQPPTKNPDMEILLAAIAIEQVEAGCQIASLILHNLPQDAG